MHEAVDFPRLCSSTICFQHGLQPLVCGALVHSQLEELVDGIFKHPEHVGNLLLTCCEPTTEGIPENNFALHWRQLPQITAEDDIDASERSLLASSLAGIINVIITNPLWVANLRIVQQRRSGDDGGDDGTGDDDDAREEPGLLTVMGRIGREEGVPGLWSGTLASLILVANPVLQFFAYEQVRLSLLGRRRRLERGGKPASLSPPEAFAVGAAAKTLATVVTYPVQLAQTLLRLPGEGGGDAGTLSCLARLYGEGGVAAWYSGMRAKLLQTVATASFMFLSYEQILAFMTGLAAGQVGGVGGG